MAATPTRIESDLYDAAKAVGAIMSRSAAQQVNHWARIGREIESAADVRHREIAKVLAGHGDYDSLDGREQAAVRAAWEIRMTEAREALNLEVEFSNSGLPWVEADDEGAVVHRVPGNDSHVG
jgi:hypothetical protein